MGGWLGRRWRQRWLLAAVEEGAGEQCAQELNNVCSLVSNWRVVWWCPRTSWRMQPCIYYCQIGTGVRWRWLGNCYCCSVLVLLGMVTDLVVPLAFNGSFPCFRLLITDAPWLKGSDENCMLHMRCSFVQFLTHHMKRCQECCSNSCGLSFSLVESCDSMLLSCREHFWALLLCFHLTHFGSGWVGKMEGNLIVIIIYVYLSFEPMCDDLHFTTELHVTCLG